MFYRSTDQTGETVILDKKPGRIVSLVPSQTELLFDLGLDEEIIGITWFCVHPEEKVKHKKKVGGTKKLKIPEIQSLNPDLIIANKEENEKEQIESLKENFPVWISDVRTLDDALAMIKEVGKLVGKEENAIKLSEKIRHSFEHLTFNKFGSVLYLIWQNPYMAAGKDTFINKMLIHCGFSNAIDENRYPVLSDHEIKKLAPDYIFLSSEPFPFKEKHIAALKKISPSSTVKLVDGELFSWYGSRLLQTVPYFKTLTENLRSRK